MSDTTTTTTHAAGVPAPWWALYGLATLLLATFAGGLVASCFIDDGTLRTAMFTGALTLTTTAIGYFFGSSKSSGDKDATISAIATGVPIAPATTVTTTTPVAPT